MAGDCYGRAVTSDLVCWKGAAIETEGICGSKVLGRYPTAAAASIRMTNEAALWEETD